MIGRRQKLVQRESNRVLVVQIDPQDKKLMQRKRYGFRLRRGNKDDSTPKCRRLAELKQNPRCLPVRRKDADDEIGL
jgi:hypothetical protein